MIILAAAAISGVIALLGLFGVINEPKAYGVAILVLDAGILLSHGLGK